MNPNPEYEFFNLRLWPVCILRKNSRLWRCPKWGITLSITSKNNPIMESYWKQNKFLINHLKSFGFWVKTKHDVSEPTTVSTFSFGFYIIKNLNFANGFACASLKTTGFHLCPGIDRMETINTFRACLFAILKCGIRLWKWYISQKMCLFLFLDATFIVR